MYVGYAYCRQPVPAEEIMPATDIILVIVDSLIPAFSKNMAKLTLEAE